MFGTKCWETSQRKAGAMLGKETDAVHDVDVKPIGIVLHDRRRALLAQAAKVGAQDGWRNDRGRRHDDLQEKATGRYASDRRFCGECRKLGGSRGCGGSCGRY